MPHFYLYVQALFLSLPPKMEKKESKYGSCMYYSANALARIMTKIADEEFGAVGLSSSYAILLMIVNESPGVQPKDISKQMQLSPSTVTRLIEKMEHRALLERKNKGRNTEVYPTQNSLDLDPKIKEAWASLYARYSDKLGKENGDKLAAAMHEAAGKLD